MGQSESMREKLGSSVGIGLQSVGVWPSVREKMNNLYICKKGLAWLDLCLELFLAVGLQILNVSIARCERSEEQKD